MTVSMNCNVEMPSKQPFPEKENIFKFIVNHFSYFILAFPSMSLFGPGKKKSEEQSFALVSIGWDFIFVFVLHFSSIISALISICLCYHSFMLHVICFPLFSHLLPCISLYWVQDFKQAWLQINVSLLKTAFVFFPLTRDTVWCQD